MKCNADEIRRQRGGSNLTHHVSTSTDESWGGGGGVMVEKKGGKEGDTEGGERNDSPGKGGCLGEKQQHMYCWRP